MAQTNLTVDSVWDSTDLTYVLRGSIVLAGDYDNGGAAPPPVPNATQFTEQRKPHITLTVQSALPDTLLADGTKIGRPGESALVKMMERLTPPGTPVWASSARPRRTQAPARPDQCRCGVRGGVDDGVDPPSNTGSRVVDPRPAANSASSASPAMRRRASNASP